MTVDSINNNISIQPKEPHTLGKGQVIDIPDKLNVNGKSIDAVVSSIKGSQVALSTSDGSNILLTLPKNPFSIGESVNFKSTQEQFEIKSNGIIRTEQLSSHDKASQAQALNSLNIDLSKLKYQSNIEGVLKNPNVDFAKSNLSAITSQTYQLLSSLIGNQNIRARFNIIANPTKVKNKKDGDVSSSDSIVENKGLRLKGVTSLADSSKDNLIIKTILGDFSIVGNTQNLSGDHVFFLELTYLDSEQEDQEASSNSGNKEISTIFNTLYKRLLHNNPQHKEHLINKIPYVLNPMEFFAKAVDFIHQASNDNFDITDGRIGESELLDKINSLFKMGQGANTFTIPIYDNENFHTLLLHKKIEEISNVKKFSIDLETFKYGEINLEGRVYKQRGKKLFDLDITIANADSEIQKEIEDIYHSFQSALGVPGVVKFIST